MPNRIIKESINESRGLAQVSPFAQDLFKRLITYADDYGRFNADLEIMRARLYPLEIEQVTVNDIEEALIELIGVDKVRFYQARADHRKDGKVFGYLPGWENHQRVRNVKGKFPEPEEEVNDWYLQRHIPVDLKLLIFVRDDFTCQECGKSFKLEGIPEKEAMRRLSGVFHIDHIVPVNQGGRATAENLRLLCESCNRRRPRQVPISELIQEAATRCNLPQSAASCGDLPPESESNPNTNPKMNPKDEQTPLQRKVNHLWGWLTSTQDKKLSKSSLRTRWERYLFDGFEVETIQLAVEEAIEHGAGDSPAYVFKVLESWREKGAMKPDAAREVIESRRRGKQTRDAPSVGPASGYVPYDPEEILRKGR